MLPYIPTGLRRPHLSCINAAVHRTLQAVFGCRCSFLQYQCSRQGGLSGFEWLSSFRMQ